MLQDDIKSSITGQGSQRLGEGYKDRSAHPMSTLLRSQQCYSMISVNTEKVRVAAFALITDVL